MNSFLSCDWGTSSFRLRWVDAATLHFSSIEDSNKGIAKQFELWKQAKIKEVDRFTFYLDVIDEHIRILEQRSGQSADNVPLIISGMASSSIGMIELGYKMLPFHSSGKDLEVQQIKAADNIRRDIIIISGVRSKDDVMRGEETQLIGCEHDHHEERIFIFPGTHSKHLWVKEGKVVDFKTYMTGEFFELLSEKSILSSSAQGGEFRNKKNKLRFVDGLNESKRSNLLHSAFLARTNHLFGNFTKEENYYFLSGLIIGTELSELVTNKSGQVTLVASGLMKELYTYALNTPGINEIENSFNVEDADSALLNGHLRIMTNMSY